ncbi:Protein phosphatase PP2A regulatory subunit B [Haplosporangium sp. Z 767]|nr:Protein phosphatase PP2A regulatory subunit B [Haplosporangium sp. Z 767]KAF9189746.1 Protein phosphatase PP2A regulatory subunit B [Haplosporangium sp. Z 11]
MPIYIGEHALEALNYTLIKDRPCRLMWSNRNPAPRKKGTGNIFIKNLDPAKSPPTKVWLFQGLCFIHYETYAAAEEAIKQVNDMLLNDRKVFVGHHIPKAERMATRKLGSKPIYTELSQIKEVRKTRLEAQWPQRIQGRM